MAIDESRWPQSSPDSDPWSDRDGPPLGAGINFSDPRSPLARFYLSTSQVVAVGILGLLFLFLNFVPLWHTDVWGHLKFGQSIVANQQLPEGNPFAPLMKQEVPSNHYSWLSQTVLYQIYHVGESIAGGDAGQRMEGGVDALRLAHALLVLLRLSILLAVFYRITESLPVSITGLVVMVLVGGANLAIFRPQVLGELCFVLLLLALSRRKLGRPALYWLPALMILWANLHGSFAIGLILMALFLAGRAIETGWQFRTWRPRSILTHPAVKPLLIVLGASVLGIALCNPAGPWIYLRTLEMANHPVVLVMDEWQPLAFTLGPGGHWSYLATLILVAGSLVYARTLPPPTAVLLLLFFALQPLWHQRALVWWLLLFPWVVLPLWVSRPADFLIGWLPNEENPPSFRKTLIALALAFVVVLWSIPGQWLISGHPSPLQRGVSEGTPWRLALDLQQDAARKEPWSPALNTWLAKHYPQGRFQGAVFTSETMGDYLVWALPEDMPVFIYAHVHLFTKEHWQRCAAVRYGTEHWAKVLDAYHINLIVVEAELNQNLRKQLAASSEWQIIVDESENSSKMDKRCRLLIAVRKQPMMGTQMAAK
jgi:hypothetical protein